MDVHIPRDNLADQMKDFRFYDYEPSMAAAVIFTVLFAITTIYHIFVLVRSKTWFMIPFTLGVVLETTGYIGRILSAKENPGPYTNGPYIIQSLLLLLAPLLFAASIYMELGRIVLMVDGESKLFVRRTWLTKIFVIGDVVTFLVQATGSTMMTSKDISKINLGHYTVIGGLVLQLIFFGLFIVSASMFHVRMRRTPTTKACERPWSKHMTGLYIASALILIRSFMRCIEFAQGYNGFVMTHEAFLYCFDALPMFVAVVTMAIVHPEEIKRIIREKRTIVKKIGYEPVTGDEGSGYEPRRGSQEEFHMASRQA